MLTFLVILLGLLVYLNIGYLWGKICWNVFRDNCDKKKEAQSFLYRMFFLASYVDQDGEDDTFAFSNTKEAYAYLMAFTWPMKVIWIAFSWIVFAGASIPKIVWKAIGKPVTNFCKFAPTLAARLILPKGSE